MNVARNSCSVAVCLGATLQDSLMTASWTS
jgi:hypothetical protein